MATDVAARKARKLDHLVLPVADLATARARLTALGFTVAPDGHHPFGTSNCCVFLPDRTYLEPLAIRNEEAIESAIEASNVFVARFCSYRFRQSNEGFSGLAFATDDAEADHERFRQTGRSAGPMLEFSRDLGGLGGTSSKATFRLAFAQDERAPDFLSFTVQRINFQDVGRQELENHANLALSTRRVVLAAPEAAYFVQSLAAVAGVGPESLVGIADGITTMRIGDVEFDLMNNETLLRVFGISSSDDRGLQARAVSFGVVDIDATERLLNKNGIDFTKRGKRIIVPPAPGQGAIFVFESNHDQA